MTNRFHRLRRLSGITLLIILVGLPFLNIRGKSALRFDVLSLRLLFFGSEIWINDFFIVLIAIIFLTFLILFATTLLGRIWCGWLCPQTVLVDMTAFIDNAGSRGGFARMGAAVAGALISTVIAASMIGYFVSPYDVPHVLHDGGMQSRIVLGSWAALTILLFLDLIWLRRKFCATVCPYAKIQNVIFDDRTLIVAFDESRGPECMQCAACVKACPVGIDIRLGTDMACIHCAECVDACTERMRSRGRSTLVRYAFGSSDHTTRGFRLNPAITGILTAASFVFLVYLSMTRMPFDATVRLNYASASQQSAAGAVPYELSLRNMSGKPLDLDLAVSSALGSVAVSPAAIKLEPGDTIAHVPIVITVNSIPDGIRTTTVLLTIGSAKDRKQMTKTIQFRVK